MAQPFEQVLETLRSLADQRLKQLEERSELYLTEIKEAVEERVSQEKAKVKARSKAKTAVRKSTRLSRRRSKAVPDEEEEPAIEEAAENDVGEEECTESLPKPKRGGGRRAASKKNAKDSSADEEEAKSSSVPKTAAKTTTRSRAKKANSAASSSSAAPSSGRMTRSRARLQKNLATIVEDEEGEEEKSPKEKACKKAEVNAEVAEDVAESDNKSKKGKGPLPKAKETVATKKGITRTSRMKQREAEQAAEIDPSKSKDEVIGAPMENDESEVADDADSMLEDSKETQMESRRRSRRIQSLSQSRKEEPKSKETSTSRRSTRDTSKTEPIGNTTVLESKATKKKNIKKDAHSKDDAKHGEESGDKQSAMAVQEPPAALAEASAEPVAAQQLSQRPRRTRTKSRYNKADTASASVSASAASQKAPSGEDDAVTSNDTTVAIAPEATKPGRMNTKRKSSAAIGSGDALDNPTGEKKIQAGLKEISSLASKPTEEQSNASKRMRTRASKAFNAHTSDDDAVQMAEAAAKQVESSFVSKNEEKKNDKGTDENMAPEQKSVAAGHNEGAKLDVDSPKNAETKESITVAAGGDKGGVSKVEENCQNLKTPVEADGRVKALALKMEEKTKEGARANAKMAINNNGPSLLEAEEAATKKAVEEAKSGGLKRMMNLLSPETEEPPSAAKVKLGTAATGASEMPSSSLPDAQLENKRSLEQEANARTNASNSNIVSSTSSFLSTMKRDQQQVHSMTSGMNKVKKGVEVKALKVAELAKKQEAARMEETQRRREAMRDRAAAAKEAKQRLDDEKRKQAMVDQQRKREEMERKRKVRDDEIRQEKRRKHEVELERAQLRSAVMASHTSNKPSGMTKAVTSSAPRQVQGAGHSTKYPPNVLATQASAARKPFAVAAPARAAKHPQSNGQHQSKMMQGQVKHGHNTMVKPEGENGAKQQSKTIAEAGLKPKPQPSPLRELTNKSHKKVESFAFSALKSVSKALVQKTPELKLNKSSSHVLNNNKTPAAVAMPVHQNPRRTTDQVESYQMTPYRSDSEESDDEGRPAKPVPQWARTRNLSKQLQAQMKADPDEIFNAHETSCSLDEVFTVGKPKPCYKRRGSSGNWLEDRVTWKEEWFYKRAMGYVLNEANE